MSLFKNLNTDGVKENGDVLGGFAPLDTNVYAATVKVAYAGKAARSDAQNVTFILDINGREYSETVYITKKTGEPYYTDKNGEKKELPGFSTINELCLLTTGQPLTEQDTQDKVVEIYDFDQRKKLPKTVPVLVDLIGKAVTAAIVAEIVDKNKDVGGGVFEPTGETRTQNQVEKFFYHEDNRTVSEIKNEVATAEFHSAWVKKNAGQEPRNKAKGAEGKAAPGRPGGSSAADKGKAAASSLFAGK